MPQSNADRQKAWRNRQLSDPETAESYRGKKADAARRNAKQQQEEIDRLQADLATVTEQRAEFYELLSESLENVMTLTEQLENTRKYNKGLHTQIGNLKNIIDWLRDDEDGSNRSNGLTADEWGSLAAMNDLELRHWVTIGKVMDRKGHDAPIDNAIRHVEGNRPTLVVAASRD